MGMHPHGIDRRKRLDPETTGAVAGPADPGDWSTRPRRKEQKAVRAMVARRSADISGGSF